MDREEQVGRRLEQIELLLEQQRVGAQRHELLARDDAFDDLADIPVDQRLAAGDRHHRRSAFVDCLEAFFNRQPPIEDRLGIIDLAAPDAGEVAAEQRLQHQDQGIALTPEQLLLEDIGPNLEFLEERYLHWSCSSGWETASWCPLTSGRGGIARGVSTTEPSCHLLT